MSFQSAIPVAESAIGVAIEATHGTPVTPPAFWLPVMAPKYAPDVTFLPDQTLQGSMVSFYDEVPSLRKDTEAWDSYPYLDTFPVLLLAALGSPDTVHAKPTNTVLTADAAVGATTVTTTGAVAAGDWIVIGTGVGVMETHRVTSVTGTYIATLDHPLYFAHTAGDTVVGLTGHTFSLLNNDYSIGNQPPSMTMYDFAGDVWRQIRGAQLNGLNIQGGADVLTKYTVDWLGYSAVDVDAPSVSYSTAEAPVGWTATLEFNNELVTECMTFEIDLKRNVKPIPAITGSQDYYQFFAGALEATAKFSVLDDVDATWLTAYTDGLDLPMDLTIADVRSGWAMKFHSSRAKFTTGSLDRSKEWVEVPLDMTLIPSSSDATAGGVSPVSVQVANAQTTAYAAA